MIEYRKGICTCHGKERTIVKRLQSSGQKLCVEGNRERLDAKKRTLSSNVTLRRTPLKRGKGLTYKRKATGEKILFETIWNTRPHVSFLTGEKLGDTAYAWNFAHVIPKAKGMYPKFKLYEKNIILLTRLQHETFDLNVRNPDYLLGLDARWKKVFDLREELLKEYAEDKFM